MKKLFQVQLSDNQLGIALLLLRVFAAVFMLTHGVPKLGRLFSGEEIKFMDFMGMGPAVSLALAVFAEFLCSVLILIGGATRLASIPLIVTMATAAFVAHADDPFGTKEKPLLFLVVFVFLLIAGAGKYSVDAAIGKRL